MALKYWLGNLKSTTLTAAQLTKLATLGRSNSVTAMTVSAGNMTLTAGNLVMTAGQVNFTAATGRTFFMSIGHDSSSAIGSATKTGAANTIAGFLKIQMTSTTGTVDRYVYAYAVSPTA